MRRLLACLAVSAWLPVSPIHAAEPEQILLDLFTHPTGLAELPFTKSNKGVRTAYVKYFEAKYADEIKAGLGDSHESLIAWLNANVEIKDTLFSALDPATDQISQALSVFRDLWAADANAVKAHPNLAIAVAVTWDDQKAIYDYRQHQVRTRSLLPSTVAAIGPGENFRYFLSHLAKLKGPQEQLPWEFLVHIVNHRTPDDERDWAITNYLKRRPGIGTIYKDVEYDTTMLRTLGEVCKLNGKPYTLPSVRQYGGVCAMQADFAARVAKSLMVPAEYVGGEANSGGLHAWVMWVEVKSVNKENVTFSLESHGRYNVDQYYIGTLKDPKSGREMTDRDMERRLTAIGQAPSASRQADLLMRMYPIAREKMNLSAKTQLLYLQRVLYLYPMSEGAWLELAAMFKDGRQTDSGEANRLAEKSVTVFAKFPDFSWRVVDDLMTPQKDKYTRARIFERMVAQYELLGRPDLACEARLKLVEYQTETKDYQKAATGLMGTIRKFPAEGRYVPKMMAKLQAVAKEYKTGNDQLVKFYQEILPRIPAKRGDEISNYCLKMHEQAVAFFKENNKPKEATATEQQLFRIRANGRLAPP